MNKSELISTIAEAANLTAREAEQVVNAVTEGITTTLTQKDTVSLIGFGTFGVKEREPREVRNPRTGEKMMTKKSTSPYFKAGKGLKDQVNSNGG